MTNETPATDLLPHLLDELQMTIASMRVLSDLMVELDGVMSVPAHGQEMMQGLIKRLSRCAESVKSTH